MANKHNFEYDEIILNLLNQHLQILWQQIGVIERIICEIECHQKEEICNDEDNEPCYFDEIFSELSMDSSDLSTPMLISPSMPPMIISCQELEEEYFYPVNRS